MTHQAADEPPRTTQIEHQDDESGSNPPGPLGFASAILAMLALTFVWPAFVEVISGAAVTGETQSRVNGIMVVLAMAAGGLRILWSVTRTTQNRNNPAWAIIGIGTLIWAAGAALSVAEGLSPVAGPGLPPMSEALHLAAVACIILGTILIPEDAKLTLNRLIDLALVLASVMAVLWAITLPIYAEAGGDPTISRILVAGGGATAIMAAASLIVRSLPRGQSELRGLFWALLLAGTAMLIAAPQQPATTYTNTTRATDALWTAVGLVLFSSGMRMRKPWKNKQSPLYGLRGVVPGAAALVGLVAVAIREPVFGGVDPVMIGLGVTILGLSALRAGVMYVQNARLFDQLTDSAADLSKTSRSDALTGLGNRLALEERLDEALRRQSPHGVTVFFIDIDNFKDVNDSLGHVAGDELLTVLADRLIGVLGNDVFRVGGDEFVAVREDMDIVNAEAVAAAIVAALGPPVTLGEHRVPSGTSVGLARSVVRSDGQRTPDDAALLLRRADLALYRAKELGRRQWASYEPWLQNRADQQLNLRHGLRDAIEQGQFTARYQPIVNLQSGETTGAEALCRWNHPTYGILLPADFLPLLDEAAMLPTLGELMLSEVLEDVHFDSLTATTVDSGSRDTTNGGIEFISLNISHSELVTSGNITRILHGLSEYAVAPQQFRLEVMERDVLDPAARAALHQASEFGVRVCIEDFGTGPTSLRHLAEFSDLTLKMDRAFLAALGRNREDRVILSSVVELARELGFVVAAEAVTNDRQAAVLRGLGVSEAQGWYFGRPTAWDELSDRHKQSPPSQIQNDAPSPGLSRDEGS